MTYFFDENQAIRYGVDEAIMISNFSFWISHNKANNKHFYDGHYWTYNSKSAFSEIFSFWSEKQIGRIVKSLVEQGVLITGNYNKRKMDKTTWYAFANESDHLGMSDLTKRVDHIVPNGQITSDQTGRPIPDNKHTDNKTDNKHTDSTVDSDKSSSFAHKQIVDFWLKEFHIGWNFKPMHGKSVKSLITQIKKILVDHHRAADDQEVIDFFKKMCLSLPDWYKDKDLPTINSKFNEIITQINNGRTKERARYGGDSIYRN